MNNVTGIVTSELTRRKLALERAGIDTGMLDAGDYGDLPICRGGAVELLPSAYWDHVFRSNFTVRAAYLSMCPPHVLARMLTPLVGGAAAVAFSDFKKLVDEMPPVVPVPDEQAVKCMQETKQLYRLIEELCDYAESATLEEDALPSCVIHARLVLGKR